MKTRAGEAAELGGRFGSLRIWYPELESTMQIASSLAAGGAPTGTVVETDYQTEGRGRQGRVWSADPGSSLLTSWILRTRHSAPSIAVLSPLVALALIRTVRRVVPRAPIRFKWPNDVLIDDRKLAGILLTSRAHAAETLIIAGIGVNVHAASVPDSSTATSLDEWHAVASARELRNGLAFELERAWEWFERDASLTGEDHAELESMMVWRNEVVDVQAGSGAMMGTLLGIERDGSLRLRTCKSGRVVALHAGEVVRGPRRVGAKAADSYRILS